MSSGGAATTSHNILIKNKGEDRGYIDYRSARARSTSSLTVTKPIAEELEDDTVNMAESFTERTGSGSISGTGNPLDDPENNNMTSDEVRAALEQAKLLGGSDDSITFSRHSRPVLEKYYMRAIQDLKDDGFLTTHLTRDKGAKEEEMAVEVKGDAMVSNVVSSDEEEKIAEASVGGLKPAGEEGEKQNNEGPVAVDNSLGSSAFSHATATNSKDRYKKRDRRAEWHSSRASSKSSRRSKFSIGTSTSCGSTRKIIGLNDTNQNTNDFSLDNTWDGGAGGVDESIRIGGGEGGFGGSIRISGLTSSPEEEGRDGTGGHESFSFASPPLDSLDIALGGGPGWGHESKLSNTSAFGNESLSAIGFMQNHMAGESSDEDAEDGDEEGKIVVDVTNTTEKTGHVASEVEGGETEDGPSSHKPSKRPSADSGVLTGGPPSKNRRNRISTSSTIHMRAGLEIMLQAKIEQARMASSMSTLGVGDTFGGTSAGISSTGHDFSPTSGDLPFEFEPDEEELRRRRSANMKSLQSTSQGSLIPPTVPIHESLKGSRRPKTAPRTIDEEEDLESTPTSSTVSRSLQQAITSPDLFESVFDVAKEQYMKDYATSFIPDQTSKYPCFDLNEIFLGFILGKGSFAQVLEVKGFNLNPKYENDTNESSFGNLNGSKSDSNRGGGSQAFLSQSMHCRRRELADSAMDLSFDAEEDYEEEEDEKLMAGSPFDKVDPSRQQVEDSNDDADANQGGGRVANRNSLNKLEHLGYDDITDDEDNLDDDYIPGCEDDGDDDSVIGRKDTAAWNGRATSPKMGSSRRFLAEHCYRAQETKKKHALERKNSFLSRGKKQNTKSERIIARFALKQLKKRVTSDPHSLLQGIADMATEARVLSSMVHPNIVKLRGVARGPNVPFQRDYFLLLDRLYDTLETRIKKWKAKDVKLQGGRGLIVDFDQSRRRQLWRERVGFMSDLASALSYIHQRHIIHRDLKPDNLGFDIRGDLKLFDFGLAKEIPTVGNGHETLYNFTSMCGSPRYMAPEVGTEEAYNELCDVYSFGIVAWEMMAMDKPFGNVRMYGLLKDVWVDDENARRPSPSLVEVGSFMKKRSLKRMLSLNKNKDVDKKNELSSSSSSAVPYLGTPASLQALLEDCWANDLKRRPPMSDVVERLDQELAAMNNNNNNNNSSSKDNIIHQD